MIFTAEPMPVQRLYDIGVVNKTVERENLLAEAESVAEKICLSGPLAVEAMKKLLEFGYNTDYKKLMNISGNIIVPVVNSDDTTEALASFVEKRLPS